VVQLIETDGRLELVSPMPSGQRVLIAVVGLVPLLAPYELLLRVDWQSFLHPFFLLAAIVSAGALAVSFFFIFAAVAGLASRITLDARTSTFTYSHVAPVVPRLTRKGRLDSIESVAVRTHQWSDGADSYSLRIVTTDGSAFETSSSWSMDDVVRVKDAVEAFLQRYRGQADVRPARV
jgi:hypothetical protein